MNRAPNIILRIIGVAALLCAAFGLWYNITVLGNFWSRRLHVDAWRHDAPYFFPAYGIMSTVCLACYGLLAFFGIQFLRGRADHLRRFAILMIFEVAYFFSIVLMWLIPDLGMSVAAATGVANGGLMVQFVIFFPLWAPLLAFWATRRLRLPPLEGTPMLL